MSRRDFRHWTSTVPVLVTLRRALGYPRKLRRVVGEPRSRVGTFFSAIREVAARYPATSGLTAFEYRVFSQNGEDGVIAEIVRRIGPECPPTFSEFGAGAGGAGNTTFLADVLGWAGLYIEPARSDFAALERRYQAIDRVRTLCEFVGPENVDALVSSVSPQGIGALPLRRRLVQPFGRDPWDGTAFFGASLGALVSLGASKGYFLAHTDLSGTNAFFVRDEFHPRFADLGPPPERASNYELIGTTHPSDRSGRRYVDLDTTPARPMTRSG